MLRQFTAAALFLTIFDFAPRASATTIIDTIQGDTFNCCAGWTVSNIPGNVQSIALPFNSASAVTITDITAFVGGSEGGSIDFGIMSASGSIPSGTFLFHQTVGLTTSAIVLTSLNWSLSAGDYFLAAVPASVFGGGAWQSNPNLQGPFPFSSGTVNSNWIVSSVSNLPEALISSNDVTATPLPAALPLFAGGLGLIGLLARRRTQRRAIAFA
jgi:hypothetical protein